MDKKSVSASLLIMYLVALFAVVGSCFYTFVFKERQISVKKVSIVSAEQISIYNNKEKTEKATSLKLSDMEIGIRPATGKLDKDTQIPSTINDEGTSEGYYATIFVDSSVDYKIVLKNINIDSKQEKFEVKEERENIFIAIKDIANTTKSLEDDEFTLVSFLDVSETQELTFFIWLGAASGDALQGAKISFDLEFIVI